MHPLLFGLSNTNLMTEMLNCVRIQEAVGAGTDPVTKVYDAYFQVASYFRGSYSLEGGVRFLALINMQAITTEPVNHSGPVCWLLAH